MNAQLIRALIAEMSLAPLACPDCGGHLELVEATTYDVVAPGMYVRGNPLPTRSRETTVLACAGCEFLEDVGLAVLA